MAQRGGHTSGQAVGLVKNTELSKYGGAVVVNLLARKLIGIVEREDPTQRKFDKPAGGGQAAPSPQMLPTNDYLEDDCIVACVPALDVDVQARHCLQQLGIECPNLLAAHVMGIPWLVVIARRLAKRRHDAIEIVLVFQADMFFDDLQRSGRGAAGTRSCCCHCPAP